MPVAPHDPVSLDQIATWHDDLDRAAGTDRAALCASRGAAARRTLPGRACWRRWSGATGGNWPRSWARPPRMGSNGCCARPSGMPTPCAMTCAPMWSSTWAMIRPCWSSMRPGFSRRGPSRQGWPGSTPARRDASRTARSGSSWPTPARRARPSWTARCICRRPGWRMRQRREDAGIPPEVELRHERGSGADDAGARLCGGGAGRLGDRGRDLRQ